VIGQELLPPHRGPTESDPGFPVPGPSGPNSVHGGGGDSGSVPTPRGVLGAVVLATT